MIDKSEAKARIEINKLLEEAGWDFDKNIILEDRILLQKHLVDEVGENFEKTKNGFIDYLLLDENKKPILIIEAKSIEKNPLVGKEQAREYALNSKVNFIILSNGKEHYFWDLKKENPSKIDFFYTIDELKELNKRKEHQRDSFEELKNFKISEDLIVDKKLRYYQLDAIKKIKEEILLGKNKFLFVMATGTGKTVTSAGIIKMFIKTTLAKKVLFLVDRIELEQQAETDFKECFLVSGKEENFSFQIYKDDKNKWDRNEILITTIQSLYENYKNFSKTEFDFIISDEAHRSIGGDRARKVFDYFNCYKLGLTATPKNTMKNIEINYTKNDFRKLEIGKMKDTYITFGCEDFKPTFSYTLEDGANDGFLVLPKVIEIETDITTELLSEKGYAVEVEHEDGFKEMKNYKMKDFERKFIQDNTNRVFCEGFINNALQDPLSGEIGKSLIFCVSQKHAFKIAAILNEIMQNKFPSKYNSDFAMAIVTKTSGDVAMFKKQFRDKQNILNGKSKFNQQLEEYKTSKTRVCVTYGMMATGYDCSDLLNIVMMRPIFSPGDFIQIKGRGTRKYLFKYENVTIKKEEFYLFDYFKNCEFFEKYYDYKKPVKINISENKSKDKLKPPVVLDSYSCFDFDKIRSIFEKKYFDVMKIDKRFYHDEKQVDSKQIYTFEDFFNILKSFPDFQEEVEKSFYEKYHRQGEIQELFDWVVKDIQPKSKMEILEELFRDFLLKIGEVDVNIKTLKKFFIGYFSKKKVREIIENKQYNKINDLNIGVDEIRFLEIINFIPSIQKFYYLYSERGI